MPKFSQEDTLVIIFSDAGAARQRSVYSRYEETYDFLERLLPKVQRLAWLNPLPRFRWQDNTAEEIDISKAYFCLNEKNADEKILAFSSKEAAEKYGAEAEGSGRALR